MTPDSEMDFNDPFGMSKFSIQRYSVQHMLLLFSINILLMVITAAAAASGEPGRTAVAATAMTLMLVMTALVVHIGLRTIMIEIWIRRLGMGDFEYRVEPWGKDEVSKACMALETLRQSSIKAMQLDTVRKLSEELQEKNQELETTLEDLRRTQNQLVSRRKVAELGELTAGLAHELRNPLQFVKNFAEGSLPLVEELEEKNAKAQRSEQGEAENIARELRETLERIVHHSERANEIVSQMGLLSRRDDTRNVQQVDVNGLVLSTAQVACHSAAAGHPDLPMVRICDELDPEIGEVPVIAEDIGRVITNVVANACQAMAEKAKTVEEFNPELTLRTKREKRRGDDCGHRQRRGYRPGDSEADIQPFFHHPCREPRDGSGAEPEP